MQRLIDACLLTLLITACLLPTAYFVLLPTVPTVPTVPTEPTAYSVATA